MSSFSQTMENAMYDSEKAAGAIGMHNMFVFATVTPLPGPQPATSTLTAVGTVTPEAGDTLVSIAAELVVFDPSDSSTKSFASDPLSKPTSPYTFAFPGFTPKSGQVLSLLITICGRARQQINVVPFTYT
jgi:hypothetical protein